MLDECCFGKFGLVDIIMKLHATDIEARVNGVPVCANNNNDCVSADEFTSYTWTQVCGRIRGYQQGCTHAFERYNSDSSLSIDDNYVDGVSITTKTIPRQHIWTYAAGVTDMNTALATWVAPVITTVMSWYQIMWAATTTVSPGQALN